MPIIWGGEKRYFLYLLMISMKSYKFLHTFHLLAWTPSMVEYHYVKALDASGDSKIQKPWQGYQELNRLNCPSLGNTVFFKTAILMTSYNFFVWKWMESWSLDITQQFVMGFSKQLYDIGHLFILYISTALLHLYPSTAFCLRHSFAVPIWQSHYLGGINKYPGPLSACWRKL